MPLRLLSGNRSESSQVEHAHRFVTTTGPGEGGEAPIWKLRKVKDHTLGRRHLRQVVVNDILVVHVVVLCCAMLVVVLASIWHPGTSNAELSLSRTVGMDAVAMIAAIHNDVTLG